MSDPDELVDAVLLLVSSAGQHGAGSLLRSSNRGLLSRHLTALSAFGIAGPIGEWIQCMLFQDFCKIEISAFRQALPTDPGKAIEKLHKAYIEYSSVVKYCCDSLRCPEKAAVFAVSVRSEAIDETGTDANSAHFFEHLRNVGYRILSDLESGIGSLRAPLIVQLHGLSLAVARSVRALWKDIMKVAIKSRIDLLPDDFGEGQLRGLMLWKERCIDVFSRMVLLAGDRDFQRPNARAELDTWSQFFDQYLINEFAEKRIAAFFDIIVEFPDSVQALQDLRLCLSRASTRELQERLVQKGKEILTIKLHHAGARTEDILAILAATIRSFCVLFSKNEAGAVVSAVVSDTLQCLKRRKDGVAAVVRAIVQPESDSLLISELQTFSNADSSCDDVAQSPKMADNRGEYFLKHQRSPDVLRVLLSTFSVGAIVHEYRAALASEILEKMPDECSSANEVLERMKCIFGSDLLAPCMVMLRDVQQSRRLSNMILKDPSGRTNVLVISSASWPNPPSAASKFVCHPRFDNEMKIFTSQFRKIKPNQDLRWMHQLSKVRIEIPQTDLATRRNVPVEFELSLFVASVLMFVASDGCRSIAEVARKMKVESSLVLQEVHLHSPNLFVVHADTIEIQRNASSHSAFVFSLGTACPEAATPTDIPPAELEMYSNMICAMLKTGGTKTVQQIENSMKMFGKFQGTTTQVRGLLQYLTEIGKISQTDANTFAALRQK